MNKFRQLGRKPGKASADIRQNMEGQCGECVKLVANTFAIPVRPAGMDPRYLLEIARGWRLPADEDWIALRAQVKARFGLILTEKVGRVRSCARRIIHASMNKEQKLLVTFSPDCANYVVDVL